MFPLDIFSSAAPWSFPDFVGECGGGILGTHWVPSLELSEEGGDSPNIGVALAGVSRAQPLGAGTSPGRAGPDQREQSSAWGSLPHVSSRVLFTSESRNKLSASFVEWWVLFLRKTFLLAQQHSLKSWNVEGPSFQSIHIQGLFG